MLRMLCVLCVLQAAQALEESLAKEARAHATARQRAVSGLMKQMEAKASHMEALKVRPARCCAWKCATKPQARKPYHHPLPVFVGRLQEEFTARMSKEWDEYLALVKQVEDVKEVGGGWWIRTQEKRLPTQLLQEKAWRHLVALPTWRVQDAVAQAGKRRQAASKQVAQLHQQAKTLLADAAAQAEQAARSRRGMPDVAKLLSSML